MLVMVAAMALGGLSPTERKSKPVVVSPPTLIKVERLDPAEPPPPPDAANATPRMKMSSRPATSQPLNVATLFSEEDYPPEALKKGLEGTVRARVTVGPDGHVTACRAVPSSGVLALDRVTCARMLAKAIYAIHRNKAKKAIAYVTSTTVTWRSGDNTPELFQARSMLLEAKVGADRKMVSCTATFEGTQEPPGPRPCDDQLATMMRAAVDYAPPIYHIEGRTIVQRQGFKTDAEGLLPPPLPPGAESLAAMAIILTVDPSGRVTECKSTDQRMPVAFTDSACVLARRLGFTPTGSDTLRKALSYMQGYLRD